MRVCSVNKLIHNASDFPIAVIDIYRIVSAMVLVVDYFI